MEQGVNSVETEQEQRNLEMPQRDVQPQIGMLKEGKKRFSMVGLMLFCGTLIVYAVQFITIAVVGVVRPDLMSTTTGSLIVSMAPTYLIGFPLMIFLLSRVPAEKVKKDQKLSIWQIILAFFMCYALMYLSNIIGIILTTVIGFLKGGVVNNTMVDIVMDTSPWTLVLVTVLCAPLYEEFIFRKLLIDRVVKFGEGIAVLLSGLLFGLFHGNLSQFTYAFTIGLFFAFIYVKTGRLRYSVILHMIINFFGSVAGLLIMEVSNYNEFMQALSEYYMDTTVGLAKVMELMPKAFIMLGYSLFIIAIVIAGVVLLVVFRKKFRLMPGMVTIPKGKRFSTVIGNVGMILFIAFWSLNIIAQLFM